MRFHTHPQRQVRVERMDHEKEVSDTWFEDVESAARQLDRRQAISA